MEPLPESSTMTDPPRSPLSPLKRESHIPPKAGSVAQRPPSGGGSPRLCGSDGGLSRLTGEGSPRRLRPLAIGENGGTLNNVRGYQLHGTRRSERRRRSTDRGREAKGNRAPSSTAPPASPSLPAVQAPATEPAPAPTRRQSKRRRLNEGGRANGDVGADPLLTQQIPTRDQCEGDAGDGGYALGGDACGGDRSKSGTSIEGEPGVNDADGSDLSEGDDHSEKKFAEMVNYLTELTMASMFRGTPGYAMEKAFNLGTKQIRSILELPSREDNAPAVDTVCGTDGIQGNFTWSPLKSDVHRCVAENVSEDPADPTRAAVDCMWKKEPPDEFVQCNMTRRMIAHSPNELPYRNAVKSSASFDASLDAFQRIGDALASDSAIGTKQTIIHQSIASIDNSTQYGAVYVTPPEEQYSMLAVEQLEETIAAAVASGRRQMLIIMEDDLQLRLDASTTPEERAEFGLTSRRDSFFLCNDFLPITDIVKKDGTRAGGLWGAQHWNIEINILVTTSAHVIVGENKTLEHRLNNCRNFLATMSVLEDAEVIPVGATKREQSIMYSLFIEYVGLGGDGNDQRFSHKGRMDAMPLGNFVNPVKPGVRALGNAISQGKGIRDHHLVVGLAVLGIDRFVQMLDFGYGIKVGDDFGAFFDGLVAKVPISSLREKALTCTLSVLEQAWLNEADRQNERERERYAKDRAEYQRIDAVPEKDRSEYEQGWLETYEATKDRRAQRENERYAKDRAEYQRIDAMSEKDRSEYEQGWLETYEATKDRKNERQNERYVECYKESKRERYAADSKLLQQIEDDTLTLAELDQAQKVSEKRERNAESVKRRYAEDSDLIRRAGKSDETLELKERQRAEKAKAARKRYRETFYIERKKVAAKKAGEVELIRQRIKLGDSLVSDAQRQRAQKADEAEERKRERERKREQKAKTEQMRKRFEEELRAHAKRYSEENRATRKPENESRARVAAKKAENGRMTVEQRLAAEQETEKKRRAKGTTEEEKMLTAKATIERLERLKRSA